MINVVKITLSLQGMFMKCVKAVKSKNGIWSRKCRRKPTLPQELHSLVKYIVSWAVAIIDIHGMDTRSIENHKSRRPGRWTGADASPVSKLNADSKIFERHLVEKLAGPSLKHKLILVSTFHSVSKSTYFDTVQWNILVSLDNTKLTAEVTSS